MGQKIMPLKRSSSDKRQVLKTYPRSTSTLAAYSVRVSFLSREEMHFILLSDESSSQVAQAQDHGQLLDKIAIIVGKNRLLDKIAFFVGKSGEKWGKSVPLSPLSPTPNHARFPFPQVKATQPQKDRWKGPRATHDKRDFVQTSEITHDYQDFVQIACGTGQ